MKLTLNEKELLALLKTNFPSTLIPNDYVVIDVDTLGYPVKEFVVTLKKDASFGKPDVAFTDKEEKERKDG